MMRCVWGPKKKKIKIIRSIHLVLSSNCRRRRCFSSFTFVCSSNIEKIPHNDDEWQGYFRSFIRSKTNFGFYFCLPRRYDARHVSLMRKQFVDCERERKRHALKSRRSSSSSSRRPPQLYLEKMEYAKRYKTCDERQPTPENKRAFSRPRHTHRHKKCENAFCYLFAFASIITFFLPFFHLFCFSVLFFCVSVFFCEYNSCTRTHIVHSHHWQCFSVCLIPLPIGGCHRCRCVYWISLVWNVFSFRFFWFFSSIHRSPPRLRRRMIFDIVCFLTSENSRWKWWIDRGNSPSNCYFIVVHNRSNAKPFECSTT